MKKIYNLLFAKKKILLFSPVLHVNDSISNSIIFQKKFFNKRGFNCAIITEQNFLETKDSIFQFSDYKINKNDIIIYHYAGMCDFFKKIYKLSNRMIIYYHNVTPAVYYKNYDQKIYTGLLEDDENFQSLVKKNENIISVSNFSKLKLMSMDFTNISVIPILFDFVDYSKLSNCNNFTKNKNDIFLINVGRILPHKNQFELIKIFKKLTIEYPNHNYKLFFIGDVNLFHSYYNICLDYINAHGIKNIYFTGMLSNTERNYFYANADVYVSTSLHEGFCMPMIESMNHNIPIVAYANAAIPETLNNIETLVYDSSHSNFIKQTHKIITDINFKNKIISEQKLIFESLNSEKVGILWINAINKL